MTRKELELKLAEMTALLDALTKPTATAAQAAALPLPQVPKAIWPTAEPTKAPTASPSVKSLDPMARWNVVYALASYGLGYDENMTVDEYHAKCKASKKAGIQRQYRPAHLRPIYAACEKGRLNPPAQIAFPVVAPTLAPTKAPSFETIVIPTKNPSNVVDPALVQAITAQVVAMLQARNA